MTFDNRYSSTVPAPLDGITTSPNPLEAVADMRRTEFEATGAAGAELAGVLARLRQAVDHLTAAQHLTVAQTEPLLRALDEASRIAMQGRLLAKVTSGSVRHHNEQVRLDQVLNHLLEKKLPALRPRIVVTQAIDPASIIVDRDLVTALIDTALDWALEAHHQVEVTLQIKDWPAHALLRIGTQATTRTQDGDAPEEKLGWYLINEIGRLLGATIDRVRSPGQALLMIEFPRTVRELDGLTAMEVEFGAPSAGGDSSRVLAGHRALIISSDVKLREDAKRVCRAMGLVADNVPSSTLAAQRCAMDPPDVLIVDERFNDERFQQLLAQLATGHAEFPVVEITYGGAPSMAAWGRGGITQVGRSDVLTQLPQALALEMSKVL